MTRAVALISLITWNALPALAQSFSFGVTGGVPLNYPAPSPCCSIQNYTDESRPYTIGPSVEFRLPAGFAIEIDALYRRLGLRDAGLTVFTSYDAFTTRWRGNVWEFPLLGKYYFRKHERWQPFLGAGMAMRYLSRQSQGNNVGLFGSFYASHYSDNQFIFGETGAVGIRLRTGRVQWLPQFRYTRWNGSGILTESNEAAILLGIAF
jgi:Outer membrane protein beta-barrel domain